MLPHSRTQLAQRWDEIAEKIDADFERRVHEFSLEPTPSRDGGSGGGIADPTATAATARDDFRSIEDRWFQARNMLTALAQQLAGKGGTPHRCARLVAGAVRQGVTPLRAKQLAHLAVQIERIIGEATPPTDAVRRFLLGQLEAREVKPTLSCEVCETPADKTRRGRLESGLCGTCYEAERHLERSGRYVDRATFAEQRREAIARQDPGVHGRYPHSPLSPKAAQP